MRFFIAVCLALSAAGSAGAQECVSDRLALWPMDSMVLSGNAAQFSATARTPEGAVSSPRQVQWKVPGGKIDKGGRFEAGDAPEKYLVTAEAGSPGAEAGMGVVEAKPSDQSPARIVVSLWDVGGGNLFNPNAKITLDVHGAQASKATLSSVNSEGARTELQTLPCRDGERIHFNAKYNWGFARALEIRLFDGQGNVLAELKRNTP
jgi:hypothetical protein